MKALQITLLGALAICQEGRPVEGFVSRKAQALFGFLAVTRRTHTREELDNLLWSEMPSTQARTNLRKVLSNLDKLLSPYLIITDKTIGLNLQQELLLDVDQLRSTIANATATLPLTPSAFALLQKAVALYQGDFLAGFHLRDAPVFEEWAAQLREQLRSEVSGALRQLLAYTIRQRHYLAGIDYARRLIQMEPWQEEAHGDLMLLLARSGQQRAALAQYETCQRVLAEELAAEPMPETTALYHRIKAAMMMPQAELPPQPTAFVGRQAELAEITGLLQNPDCRLLVIIGPGGIGKSRLAWQAATVGREDFLHGIVWVTLTELDAANRLDAVLADALQLALRERADRTTQLFHYLHEKELLLVLDNFDQPSVESLHLIAEILRVAPYVKLMVTARARLQLREEWLVDLAGLAYPARLSALPTPPVEPEDLSTLATYDAPQLFLQCAQRIHRGFVLDAEIAPALVHICQLVEGMPLAIELAAALVRTHSCAEIAREIGSNLDFLTSSLYNVPPRHHSLRAVFTYTWACLTAAEQALFRKLALFPESFSAEAASQVADASPALLAALQQKNVLRRDPAGRYALHSVLRHYAGEELSKHAAEEATTQAALGRYFMTFLGDREVLLKGARQVEAMNEIGLELKNIRSAWDWAVRERQSTVLAGLFTGLAQVYCTRGWYHEGVSTFSQAAAALDTPAGQESSLLGQLLAQLAHFHFRLSQHDEARTLLRRSLAILRRMEDRLPQACTLTQLGHIARVTGDYEEARQLYETSLALHRELAQRQEEATDLQHLGFVAHRQGKYAEAKALYEQSLLISRAFHDQWAMAQAIHHLGLVDYHLGNYAAAEGHFMESLTTYRTLNAQPGIALVLISLGAALHMLGRYHEAEACYRESLTIERATGYQNGIALALTNLGDLAETLGNYGEAKRLFQEALTLYTTIGDRRGITWLLNHLGNTACALGDYRTAREYYLDALRSATAMQAEPQMLDSLVGIAGLLAKHPGEQDRARRLLHCALHHPTIEAETKATAAKLAATLAGQHPSHRGHRANRHLGQQSLFDVVDDLLRGFEAQLIAA